jgi:hypothetical protein
LRDATGIIEIEINDLAYDLIDLDVVYLIVGESVLPPWWSERPRLVAQHVLRWERVVAMGPDRLGDWVTSNWVASKDIPF